MFSPIWQNHRILYFVTLCMCVCLSTCWCVQSCYLFWAEGHVTRWPMVWEDNQTDRSITPWLDRVISVRWGAERWSSETGWWSVKMYSPVDRKTHGCSWHSCPRLIHLPLFLNIHMWPSSWPLLCWPATLSSLSLILSHFQNWFWNRRFDDLFNFHLIKPIILSSVCSIVSKFTEGGVKVMLWPTDQPA